MLNGTLCIQAIQTEEKDDDTHWLIYWTVFAFFSLIDFFADKIMGILPLYWLAKVFKFVFLFEKCPLFLIKKMLELLHFF